MPSFRKPAVDTNTESFWWNNSLSIVAFGFFLITLIGQSIVGLHAYNGDRDDRGQWPVSYFQYLHSGHFIEGVSENWESAFLELTVFVFLSKFLRQKGSSESRDPADHRKPKSYSAQGWGRYVYAHSLTLVLLTLFLMSVAIHAYGGSRKFSESEIFHHRPAVGFFGYFLTSSFWFESLQNWQSEFLSVLTMAVLTIFLREAGSPQSKPVDSPNWKTEK